MGKVYLIASGKGGTGKTMFAANFGATLAEAGKRVVVVDMDMGQRNLDLYLGLENNVVYDVYDVMMGICRMKQAIIRDKRFEELYMLAASPERQVGELTHGHMKMLCENLRENFDYVLIDAPAGIDEGLFLAACDADEAIIVTTPEYASLRDADVLDRELIRSGIRRRYLVVNKLFVEMMNKGYTPGLSAIDQMVNAELVGVIQFDMNINISTNLGEPIVLKKGTYIEENFRKITGRILAEQ